MSAAASRGEVHIETEGFAVVGNRLASRAVTLKNQSLQQFDL
jgi:hypothetical protein